MVKRAPPPPPPTAPRGPPRGLRADSFPGEDADREAPARRREPRLPEDGGRPPAFAPDEIGCLAQADPFCAGSVSNADGPEPVARADRRKGEAAARAARLGMSSEPPRRGSRAARDGGPRTKPRDATGPATQPPPRRARRPGRRRGSWSRRARRGRTAPRSTGRARRRRRRAPGSARGARRTRRSIGASSDPPATAPRPPGSRPGACSARAPARGPSARASELNLPAVGRAAYPRRRQGWFGAFGGSPGLATTAFAGAYASVTPGTPS